MADQIYGMVFQKESKPNQMGVAQAGRTYRLLVVASSEQSARQQVCITCPRGKGQILSCGRGEAGLEALTGLEDETWVWDGVKWFCL